MRYENIKSGILTILVLVSILLTWSLWTYQPKFDMLEENSNYVAGVTVSEKQEVQKIVKPDQVLFHIKGQHYGTNSSAELEKLMKDMGRWSIFDVRNYSDKVENIEELLHSSGNAEIIFPGEVPIELYRSVLTIEGKRVPSFNFNRILINVDNAEKENGILYFVSSENQQVYIGHISSANVNEFNREFYKNANRYPQYFAYKATDKRTLFLPEAETEMTAYKYLPVTLNSDEFKGALFNDPRFVQKSFVLPQSEEYTNDSSKLIINNDTNILSYVNPTAADNYLDSSYGLVKRSIDFVNEHGGWTDAFRYVSKSEYKQSVTFRLYSMEGYPVFNDRGLSEINEVWGKDEINRYVRPNISLDLVTETKMATLPSGHAVVEYLQKKKNFKPELLDKLILGYRMDRDSEEKKLILLEPAWFYLYDGNWEQITMENQGGLKYGLE